MNRSTIPYLILVAGVIVASTASITVITHDEAYTSKCSFFDGEPVGRRVGYAGKRVHRGLFRTASGMRVNADINAAYNQYLSPTLVTVAILGEPLGSAAMALVIFRQTLQPLQLVGGAILLTGIIVATLAERRATPSA